MLRTFTAIFLALGLAACTTTAGSVPASSYCKRIADPVERRLCTGFYAP